jgi:hypothetical protein
LDKIFREQPDAFEVEPMDGHFMRFETKLDSYHAKQKKRLPGWTFLKIASVIIIVLLSANLAIQLLPGKKAAKQQMTVNSEMNETAQFYNTRINSGIYQLQKMADRGIGSELELNQVKKELDEMDRLHQDLQKEFSKNPNDERIINAMIEYYQTKLDIINTIKSDLENVKSIKNNKNENTQL